MKHRDWRFESFYCDGCKRRHGRYVFRTKTVDGLTLCDRAYDAHVAKRERLKIAPTLFDLEDVK